jgi:hypothetical protein
MVAWFALMVWLWAGPGETEGYILWVWVIMCGGAELMSVMYMYAGGFDGGLWGG